MSVILSEVTHVTPFLAAPEFYVDTFNDGSVAGVPISMSLTLAFYLTTPPTHNVKNADFFTYFLRFSLRVCK